MTSETKSPVRIANCSGFYGDRISAAKEMVDGGPIDVLTGDWLAELEVSLCRDAGLEAWRLGRSMDGALHLAP